MVTLQDDSFTKEFLVYISVHDRAPQRMRLKLGHLLSADDLLLQIGRQFIDPCLSIQSTVASHGSPSHGSHLFAFSAEENCFFPVDGRPAEALKYLDRLVVHTSSVLPLPNSTGLHSRPSSIGYISHRASTPYDYLCSSHSQYQYQHHPRQQQQALASQRPQSIRTRTPTPLDGRTTPLGPPLRLMTSRSPLDSPPSPVAAGSARVVATMDLMLQVTGFLLADYVARAVDDVVQPTEESLWSLVEETLYHSGGTTPLSLDHDTVDAFLRTILRSVKMGRAHRAVDLQAMQQEESSEGVSGATPPVCNGAESKKSC